MEQYRYYKQVDRHYISYPYFRVESNDNYQAWFHKKGGGPQEGSEWSEAPYYKFHKRTFTELIASYEYNFKEVSKLEVLVVLGPEAIKS